MIPTAFEHISIHCTSNPTQVQLRDLVAHEFTHVALESCNFVNNFMEPLNYVLVEDGAEVAVQLPLAFYSLTQLAAALQASLNAATQEGQVFAVTTAIATRIDGLLTITATTLNVPTSLRPSNRAAAKAVGLADNGVFTLAPTATSTQPCNLTPYQEVFVVADQLDQHVCTQNVLRNNLLLAVVNIAEPPFAVVTHRARHAYDARRLKAGASDLFTFTLTDNNFTPLDTRGQHFQLNLVFYDFHNLEQQTGFLRTLNLLQIDNE